MPETPTSTIELLIAPSCRVRFAVPSDWSQSHLNVAANTPVMDAEGRLPVRFTAENGDRSLRLDVAGSAMQLPSLTSAIVYWAQLYGFDDASLTEAHWGGHPAYSGCFEIDSAPEGAAWIQTPDAIVEFRLRGDSRPAIACTLTLLKSSFISESLPQVATLQPNDWITRVRDLRDAGRLDEAIALANDQGTIAEVLLMQADMHAERMRFARERGDMESARAAWRAAVSCIRSYGASATSGGEGAARAIQCERALDELGPEPA